VRDWRKLRGPGHPDLVGPLNHEGNCLIHQGRPAAAEPCYREAVDIARATMHEDHVLRVTSITSLGTPGLISFLFLATAPDETLFYPYGTLLVDPLSSFVFVPWPGPPANPSFVIPGFLPTPQPIAMQQIVFQGSTAGGGNLSNLEYFVIQAP
jgi:hypothetical protein